MLQKKTSIVALCLFLMVAGLGFSDFPDTTHACATQSDGTITVTFTIPLVDVTVQLHRVELFFSFDDLDDTLVAGDFNLDPFNELGYPASYYSQFDFANFYDNTALTQVEIEVFADGSAGYIMRLHDEGSDAYKLEVLNKPEGDGYWEDAESETWILTISNIGDADGYEFNLDSMQAYTSNIETDLITPVPSGYECTAINPCNVQPTVAGINADPSPDTPLDMVFSADTPNDADGSVDEYDWHYNYTGVEEVDETRTNHTPFPYTEYDTDGTYTVRLRVKDDDGAYSSWVSTDIYTNQRPDLAGIDPKLSETVARGVDFTALFTDPAHPDPDDDSIEYHWDVDDDPDFDEMAIPYTTGTYPHTYPETDPPETTYIVRLKARDQYDLFSDEQSVVVNPDNIPVIDSVALELGSTSPTTPVYTAGTVYATEPAAIELSGTASDDTDPVSVLSWDMDGNGIYTDPGDIIDNAPFENQTAPFQEMGVYQVRLRATAGNFDSAVTTVPIYILPDENMHFARALGLPYDSGKSPFVDGIVSGLDGQLDDGVDYGENGWRSAYKQVYGSGVVGTDFVFQGIKDNIAADKILYFSFEVSFDDTLASDDEIVLGFRGNSDDPLAADTSTDRLVRIDPSAAVTGDSSGNGSSIGIQVFERSGDVWSSTPNPSTPPGLVCAKQPRSGNTWTIEIQVPMDADAASSWEAIDSQFLFFFNIRRSVDGAAPTIDYGWWPTGLNIAPADDFFIDDTGNVDYVWSKTRFNPLWWGRVDLDDTSAVNGLSFTGSGNVGSIPVDVVSDPGYDAATLAESGALTSSFKYHDPLPNNYTNIIIARVENDTHYQEINGSGSIVRRMLNVPEVSVSFKLANWGIPPEFPGVSYWEDIPGSPRPAKTVPMGDPVTGDPHIEPFYFEWVIPDADITGGKFEDDSTDGDNKRESHQCIYVEIHALPNSSPDPDDINEPRIVTKSVHRNMNFDAVNPDEKFTHRADISAIGYGDALTDNPNQKFLLRIYTRFWEVNLKDKEVKKILNDSEQARESTALDVSDLRTTIVPDGMSQAYYYDLLNQKKILRKYIEEERNKVSFIEYIVKGFLYTGKTVTINGKKMDVVRSVGSYGHQIRHEGTVEDWEFEITGEGVTRLDKNTYLLEIEPETTKRTYDNVQALEPPKWRTYMHTGVAIPFDTLASTNTIGPNVIVGLGYHIVPRVSISALFGYNYLPAQATAGNATHLMNASLNGRFYQPLKSNFSLYAGLGPGLYFDTGGTSDFGANAGIGVNLRLQRLLALEAGLDYHRIFTVGSQYLHGHIGVLFRF